MYTISYLCGVIEITTPDNNQLKERRCYYVKVRAFIRLLERHDFVLIRQKGSHRQYRKSGHPYVVTVAGKLSDEIDRGTLASMLRQAGLTRDDL